MVVYGVEGTICADDLLRLISSSYNNLIHTNPTRSSPPRLYTNLVSTSTPMDGFSAASRLVYAVSDILSGSAKTPSALQIKPRLYLDNKEMLDVDYDTASFMTVRIISPALRQQFDSLRAQIAFGQVSLKTDLEDLVRDIAARFARSIQIKLAGTRPTSRFFGTGTPPDLSSNGDIRNVIFSDDVLREIYANSFMNFLGIDYNVCLKCSVDRKSPPFSDVAATYLADLMDKRDRTRPTVVMVRPLVS